MVRWASILRKFSSDFPCGYVTFGAKLRKISCDKWCERLRLPTLPECLISCDIWCENPFM